MANGKVSQIGGFLKMLLMGRSAGNELPVAVDTDGLLQITAKLMGVTSAAAQKQILVDADGILQISQGGLIGTLVWDPGNLIDGTGETSGNITVTGAIFGDYVLVGAPYDLQGITCTAYVNAADSVRIRLQNETGGTIDLASGTWKVKVIK